MSNTARRRGSKGRGRGNVPNSLSYNVKVKSSPRSTSPSPFRASPALASGTSGKPQSSRKRVTLDQRFTELAAARRASLNRAQTRSTPTPRSRSVTPNQGNGTRSSSPVVAPVLLRVLNLESKKELTAFVAGAVHAILMEKEYISPRVIKEAVQNGINAWYAS